MFEKGSFYRKTVEEMESFQFSEEQIEALKQWCQLGDEERKDKSKRRDLGYDIFPDWFIGQMYQFDVIDDNIDFDGETINVGDYCLKDSFPKYFIIIKKEDVNISTIGDFFPDDNDGKHIAWIDEY